MSSDTRQRILLATIACIERSGLPSVRTRDIAAEAGVNLAAINYHFGSKDALVEQAIALTVHNGLEDVREALGEADAPVLQRVEGLLVHVIARIAEFPNLTRAHLHGAWAHGDVDSSPFLPGLLAIQHELAASVPDAQRGAFADALNLALTAAIVAGLAPDWQPAAGGADPRTPEGRAAIANRLLRMFPGMADGDAPPSSPSQTRS